MTKQDLIQEVSDLTENMLARAEALDYISSLMDCIEIVGAHPGLIAKVKRICELKYLEYNAAEHDKEMDKLVAKVLQLQEQVRLKDAAIKRQEQTIEDLEEEVRNWQESEGYY